MMRVICLLLVSVFAIKLNAQQYTKFNGYGFQADRLKADSISIHPSDTVRNKAARSIAVLNGVFYIADGTKWKVVGTDTTSLSNRINLKLNISDTATMLSPYSKLKSVGLSMPSAFNVANSPLTSDGTLAVTGAGNATQYVRGDGVLATLPTNGSGGGASVSYYLNGSVNQGTIGGVTYYEMNRTPIIGAGTDFVRNSNGYIASFLTDANDPALLNIPAGNWNFETYFQASSGGGSPTFYIELYKYDGTTFTLIASNSGSPKLINDGTNIEAYFSALAVPQTTLTLTDRLAIRIYVNTSSRTITLHTENSHLCQVITTFTTGLTALNGLTSQVQYFATGTTGTDFNISSVTDTHTFNLPTASATNRGALSSANWTTFNNKQNAITLTTSGTSGASTLVGSTLNIPQYQGVLTNPITGTGVGTSSGGRVPYFTGTTTQVGSDNLWWDNTNARLGIGTASPSFRLDVNGTARINGTKYIAFNPSFSVAGNIRAGGVIATTGNFSIYSDSGIPGEGFDVAYWNGSVYYPGIRLNNVASGFSTLQLMKDGGNVLIGTTTDAGFRLDVNGTARVQGNFTQSAGTSAAFANGITLDGTRRLFGSGTITHQSNSATTQHQFRNEISSALSGTIVSINNSTGEWGASNANSFLNISGRAAIASGVQDLTSILISNSVENIGTYTGTIRGIYYNPSSIGGSGYTHRAIQTVRGDVILGSTSGSVGIGANTSINASAILDVTSTTQGFLPPRMTTAQRDLIATPAAGLVIYNTSTNKHQGYNGTTWNDFY
jgi:hypothetical protein